MQRTEIERSINDLVAQYETFPGFPLNYCTLNKDASKRMNADLVHGWWTGPKKGLFERAMNKQGFAIPKTVSHFMFRDTQSGVYFDFSARQFMPELPRILVLTPDDPRITCVGDIRQPEELYKVGGISLPPDECESITLFGKQIFSW